MNSGKKEKFIKLLDSNKRIIYKIVNSYSKDQADRKDLEQEIILQLWHSFDKYDANYKYTTWMYRIALNVAISFYRKKKTWQSKHTSFSEESLLNIENEVKYKAELDENLKLLQQFINGLDELNKALILLYLDGKKYEDIADILGITKTNTATKISRLKIRLSKEFKKRQNDGNI